MIIFLYSISDISNIHPIFYIRKIYSGATIGAWTRDLILTMDALYQLSYRGITGFILAY